MTLLALSYPTISEADWQWIQAIRVQHDPQYGMVAPHFTLVFPTRNHAPQPFSDYIRRVLQPQPAIHFTVRCAVVVKDVLSGATHTFLVPDQGFSEIVKLHDKFYGGPLADELRLDIPFIPHMSIAASRDAQVCKRIADAVNAQDVHIAGTLRSLDIVQFANSSVTTLKQISLS